MEINVNFVLFDGLEESPNCNEVQTHIVIIRQDGNTNFALDKGTAGFNSPK